MSDENSLFKLGIRGNIELCAVAGSIPICSRAGYQAATMLRELTLDLDTGYRSYCQEGIFLRTAEMLGFWAYDGIDFERCH